MMCLKIKIVMSYYNKPISHHFFLFKICWNVNLVSNKVLKQPGIKKKQVGYKLFQFLSFINPYITGFLY